MSAPGIAPPAPVVPASPTAFTINVIWDTNVATAPTGFTTDVLAAIRYLESEFSDPVTMTITIGYNEVGGEPLDPKALGENIASLQPVSLQELRAGIIANAKTPTDASVVASLPASSPIANANYWVTTAQAKAIGLASPGSNDIDGEVGFANSSNFTFGDTPGGGFVAPGTYDFFATAVHEITEVMGRQMLVGGAILDSGESIVNGYELLDLLHWSAPGRRDFTQTTPGYFSVNSGATNAGEFNTLTNGDSGDWALSMPGDPFDAFASPGVPEPVTSDDLAEMDALGWNPAGTPATITPVIPNQPAVPARPSGGLVPVREPVDQLKFGVWFVPDTRYLAVTNGLAVGMPLASVTQDVNSGGGSVTYALGGAGDWAFSLVPVTGGAELQVGPTGVAGKAGGLVYPLTVTATGSASASTPVNVVIGSDASETITPASLANIVTTAPTFIHGLSGNDIINGTGMSGALFFDVGTGVDMMAGGSGMNVYEFDAGAGAPATPTVQDIITNFKVSVDLIDLTWVGWRFSGAAALGPSAATIAPGSIGWQASGGNTFVYANTSSHIEALTATDVKIELEGNIALTSANFAHT